MEPDRSKSIMHKAAALLARRSFSRGELRARLARFGDPDQIEPVLDRLEELNLLNDADYAYNFAVRWIRQEGWGPIKVLHMLKRRHVGSPLAEAAIDRVRLETSDTAALESFLDRRGRTHPLPGDRKGIHKLVMALRRRGYPEEVIREVLRQRIPAAAWQNFDTGE
jgi:regulatory protein